MWRVAAARTACSERFGAPDEIARAAAFLAFDATYTTGTEFVADGGATQL